MVKVTAIELHLATLGHSPRPPGETCIINFTEAVELEVALDAIAYLHSGRHGRPPTSPPGRRGEEPKEAPPADQEPSSAPPADQEPKEAPPAAAQPAGPHKPGRQKLVAPDFDRPPRPTHGEGR